MNIQLLKSLLRSKAPLPILTKVAVRDGLAMTTNLEAFAVTAAPGAADGIYSLVGQQLIADTSCGGLDDFPAMVNKWKKGNKSITIPAARLALAIAQVAPAMSDDPSRMVLNGIFLEVKGGEVVLVATNGRQLHQAHLGSSGGRFEMSAIIPSAAIKPLNNLLRKIKGDSQDKIVIRTMTLDNGGSCPQYAEFTNGGGDRLLTKLVEGVFPNYRQVIPTDFAAAAWLNAGQVQEAVRSLMPIVKANQKVDSTGDGIKIQLAIAPTGMSMTMELVGTDPKHVEVRQISLLAMASPCWSHELAVSAIVLDPAIRNLDPAQPLMISVNDQRSPVRIAQGKDNSFLAVFMPMCDQKENPRRPNTDIQRPAGLPDKPARRSAVTSPFNL